MSLLEQKGYDRPPPAYPDINGQHVETPPNDGSCYYDEYSEFVDVSQIGKFFCFSIDLRFNRHT
jgi:hypothetical protein